MALRGSGMVIMWHDITPEGDEAYNAWHTREHMPERIALPGFQRSRRGVNRSLERQHYFTLYECDDLRATVSAEYQRSLNQPTAWTQQVAPTFRNFKRMACRTLSSQGSGVGGAVATFRATLLAEVDAAALLPSLAEAVKNIMETPAVTGAHIAVPQPDFTNGETTEVKIRPVMTEPEFAIVVIVEGIGLAELSRAQEGIAALLAGYGLGEIIAQSYDMAYMLDVASAA